MREKLSLAIVGALTGLLCAGTVSADVNGAPCFFGSEYAVVSNRVTVSTDVGSNGWVEVQAGDYSSKTLVQGDIIAGGWARVGGAWSEVGDITAGEWIDVQQGSVTGDVLEWASVTPITLPTKDVSIGTDNFYLYEPNCDLTIAPGDYSDIYVNQGCTLTLTSGVYNVGRLVIQSDAALEIQGNVDINAKWEFTFGNSAALLGVDLPENLEVYSNGDVFIGTHTSFRGMVLAPNGNAQIGNNSSFTGCIQGARTVAQTGVNVVHARDYFCNPELNSVITAHGNTDWHIDTAHEFLFGYEMDGDFSAANHVPDTWNREHIHVGLSSTQYYYYDETLITSGADMDATNGIDTEMLFFYAGHGSPTTWSTLGGYGTQRYMKLGNCDEDGSLRYYWQCSCKVFAHGPYSCDGGGWNYSCPEDFDGSADSYSMRNVYERWGPVLDDGYLRMACGASTSAYCHETQTNRIWNNYNNLGFGVADSFIFGLHSSGYDNPVVPLCITKGGEDVTSTPLYDQTFTNLPNLGGDNYYIQFLDQFASDSTSDAGGTSDYFLYTELPVFEVVPDAAPSEDLYALHEEDRLYVSRNDVQGRGPDSVIFQDSGAKIFRGEKGTSAPGEVELDEAEYLASANTFVDDVNWEETYAGNPQGVRVMIEKASMFGEPMERFQKNVGFSYRREIPWEGNSLPVVGSGGQMIVQLNNDGSVLNAIKVWRPAMSGEMVSLKPFETALEEAISQLDNAGMYELSDWSWGYKEEAADVQQDELRVVIQFAFKSVDAELDNVYPPQMIEIDAQ